MVRQFLLSPTFGGWVAGASGAYAIIEWFDPPQLVALLVGLSISLFGVLLGVLVDAVSGGGPR